MIQTGEMMPVEMTTGMIFGVGVCLLVTCHLTSGSGTLPGLTIQLSESGLQTAAKVAVDQLTKDVQGKVIDNQKGHDHGFKWELSSIQITSFTRPASSLAINPGQGITWSLTGAGTAIHGNWHWRKSFVSDHGSFDVNTSGISLTVSITMGVDHTGRPTIAMRACSASVGHVGVKIHGRASFLYNLFKGHLAKVFKDKLKSMMCDSVSKAISQQAAQSLAKMKVQVPVGKLFTLDYRLVSPPVFVKNYLETLHKGEFQWSKSPSEAPFQPSPIPTPPGPQKMVTFCLSDYVVNTMAYVGQAHGLLNHTLTRDDLPKNDSGYLNTTCSFGKCVGTLFPQIGKLYPNATIEMAMRTDTAPTLNSSRHVLTANMAGQISFNVRLLNGSGMEAFSTRLMAALPVTANLTGNRVTARFQAFKFQIINTTSNVGPIPDVFLKILFNLAEDKFVLPQLNALGQKGFGLPELDHVRFVNAALSVLENASCFATDVQYDPTLYFAPHQ